MKILLVCESFSAKLSGGKVVRYLHKILANHGHDVRVAITSPFDEKDTCTGGEERFIVPIRVRKRYYWRVYALANSNDVPHEFERLLSEFAPDVVHFASFDHTKSPNLYRHCKERGIRTVLQPWTMHFYCAQGFGYMRGRHCTRCLDDGFSTAITQGCTNLRGAVGQLERAALHQLVPGAADVLLSSNVDLDGVLRSYGISSERVQYFPVAFDITTSSAAGTPATRGDYYIYYGQTASHKGTDFLIELFSELPGKQLRIYPMAPFSTVKPLPPNISVIAGLGWDTGLREAIANAKAVLVPSLWMTSTEYSLCEAMVMKKPVIAFDVGAHKNILSHRETAMVVQLHDKTGFRAALDELDGDETLYDRLAEAGAARIAEINAPEKLHAQLMVAYGQDGAT